MLAAFISTGLFSLSIICASRSTRMLGGVRANFYRILLASLLLGIWAHLFGGGLGGPAQPLFFLSGCIGFGIGDMALYQALPKLGARLSMVLVHCVASPCATAIEWLWLGTEIDGIQLAAAVMTLSGVAIALAPSRGQGGGSNSLFTGITFGVIAALGQAVGAVISRKAFAVNRLAGIEVDGGTAAYQRILGGVLVTVAATLLVRKWRETLSQPVTRPEGETREVWHQQPWVWVVANSLAGPTIGVSFFQLALKTTASGIVLPIVATTPIVVIPLAYWIEGDRPTARSLIGGAIAVAGTVVLAMNR